MYSIFGVFNVEIKVISLDFVNILDIGGIIMEELFKPEALDMRVIDDISKVTGIKFSDEQMAILKHRGGMCILACAGSGKALKNGTGVLTNSGYVPVEKLKLLDIVFDQNGNRQVVVGVYPQGRKQVYEVEFRHGKVIKCSPDHLWTVSNNTLNTLGSKVMNTAKMYDTMYKDGKGINLPAAMPIKFGVKKGVPLEFDPYLVGFMVASNSFLAYNNKYEEQFKFNINAGFKSTEQIEEMLNALNVEFNKLDLKVDYEIQEASDELADTTVTAELKGEKRIKVSLNDFVNNMYHMGMVNSGTWNMNYIPEKYLYNSIEVRQRILNGIFDTAGIIKRNKLVINLPTRRTAEQVEFLLETLGYWDIDTHNFKQYRGAYRISIYLHEGNQLPSTLTGFSEQLGPEQIRKSRTNKVISIRKTNKQAEMTCIKVSGNSELFLTEHCIVTHNTSILTNLIAKRILTHEIQNPNTLLCTTYSNPGADEMNIRLNKLLSMLGISYKITVKTMHAIYLKILREFGYPTTVVDSRDRRRYLSEACKDAKVPIDDETFQTIDSLLSFQINNLMNDKALVHSYAYTLPNVSLEQYSKVRQGFILRKGQARVIDFDDMQLYIYSLMCNSKVPDDDNPIIRYCKNNWTDIYIDEAQDLSRIQYAILGKMISDTKKLVVIGDDDQCLIQGTKLLNINGIWQPIETLSSDDGIKIRGYAGKASYKNGGTNESEETRTIDDGFYSVDRTSCKHIDSEVIRVTTESGNQVTATPEHIGFFRTSHRSSKAYVVLFYKHGYGYKIGYLSSKITLKNGVVRNNLKIRMLQENTDKAYIIDSFDTEAEACRKMLEYSKEYNLPTVRLNDLDETGLRRVFNGHRGTEDDALRLLYDKGINPDYPILFSKAIGNKSRALIELFSYRHETGDRTASRLKVATMDPEIKKIADSYNPIKSEVSKDEETGELHYRCIWISLDTDYIETTLKHIEKDAKAKGIELECLRSIQVSRTKMNLIPFSNIRPGMFTLVFNDETRTLKSEQITKVERLPYNGKVYDVNVDKAHNMVADGVLVHNCIYQWRGADPSIISNVCADYNIERFTLTTNYRCAGTIVDHAAVGVQFNTGRTKKQMRAYKPGGEIKICDCGTSNLYIMSKYAYKYIKELVIEKEVNPASIAVLSRNNNHLSLLGNMLFKDGIHCEATNEMKMTKLFSYGPIKDILELARDTKNSTLTENILADFCPFLLKKNAALLASVQSASGMKFSDMLGYIAKNMLNDENATYTQGIVIPATSMATLNHVIGDIQNDTKTYLDMLYHVMTEPDISRRAINLLNIYIFVEMEE